MVGRKRLYSIAIIKNLFGMFKHSNYLSRMRLQTMKKGEFFISQMFLKSFRVIHLILRVLLW